MVHHVLEGGRGVAKTKVHDHWFVQTILGLECCFVLVSIFDVYFVEASFNVEFGKDKRVLYFCDEFWYEREWLSVANRPLVDPSVVLYWSLRTVGLLKEEEGRCDW